MSRTLPVVLTAALNLTQVLFMPAPANTQEAPEADPSQIAAFLFAYDIPPGMQTRFEEGYRRHLEWHRQAKDPLVWYGWYVMTGNNLGRFVDGTFGLRFDEFDQRVDPSGDRTDAEMNFSPYVEPVYRRVFRLRRDLNTGFPLESLAPTQAVEVSTPEAVSTLPGRHQD